MNTWPCTQSGSTANACRLSPVTRLVAAVIFVCVLALLPRMAWPAYALAAIMLLLIALLSGVNHARLAKRILLLEPFVLGVSILSLFQPGGLYIFLALLTKSTLCLSCMVFLSETTPFSDIFSALRLLKAPDLLVTTLALMHRYLFLLIEEMRRIQRARKSRTFSNRRSLIWHSLASIIAQLFVRTSERAERIYMAMCARGFNLKGQGQAQ